MTVVDDYELVDREYENCPREEYPRQIKTRKSSFNSILQRFTNFRINRLKDKLARMEKDSLTSQYFQSNPEGAIEKKSRAIARVEEKIKILSKEDVPSDYVSKRAIKLKKNMIENLHKNANNLYSIGMSKRDAVFSEEVAEVAPEEEKEDVEEKDIEEEAIDAPVEEVTDEKTSEEEKIDVTGDKLDRQTIEDSINAEFSNISKEEFNEKIDDELNRRTIEDTINTEFSNLEKENKPEEYTEVKGSGLTAEEIEEIINNSFNRLHPQSDITKENVEKNKEESKAMESYEFKKDDDVRVSRNNSSSARLFRYDRDGSDLKEYNYVPMTDEEIRIAQRKIGLDENGNFIATPKINREKKVGTATIVEDKIPSIVIPNLKLEDILIPPKNNVFTLREKPVVIKERDDEKASIPMGKDDYAALKENILYLKNQAALTRKQKEEAQRKAEESAEKAREIKEMFEESQKNYAQSLDLLRAYQEALREDCSNNEQGTRDAENDTRLNNDFISTHREKMNYNNRIISEIGSLIGSSEEEHKGYR